jgi:hypothetical protein
MLGGLRRWRHLGNQGIAGEKRSDRREGEDQQSNRRLLSESSHRIESLPESPDRSRHRNRAGNRFERIARHCRSQEHLSVDLEAGVGEADGPLISGRLLGDMGPSRRQPHQRMKEEDAFHKCGKEIPKKIAMGEMRDLMGQHQLHVLVIRNAFRQHDGRSKAPSE